MKLAIFYIAIWVLAPSWHKIVLQNKELLWLATHLVSETVKMNGDDWWWIRILQRVHWSHHRYWNLNIYGSHHTFTITILQSYVLCGLDNPWGQYYGVTKGFDLSANIIGERSSSSHFSLVQSLSVTSSVAWSMKPRTVKNFNHL